MIHNLKILIAAAMALAAFGAISASGAQAAEFHCSVQPCTVTIKADGALGSKQAHQVFIVKQGATSVSVTCQQVTGDATSPTKTFITLTLTNITYHTCSIAGLFVSAPASIRMNGCEYHYVVGGIYHATAQIQCPAGKVIEIEQPETRCLITIGNTGVLTGGLTFKDAETGGIKKTEVTAETTVVNVPVMIANKLCPWGLVEGAATGEYTTGNVELTGETDTGKPEHADLWWESGAQAAEGHCGVKPCTITVKPDGVVGSKQAHQVLIINQGGESVSTTCQQVTGDATSATKTFKTLTLTNIEYHDCNVAGAPSTVEMNGCEYHFVVGGTHHATAQVKCPAGKVIEIEATESKCLITIGNTEVLPGGLTFKDAETGGIKKTEVTAETTVTNIPAVVANNKCPAPLKEGAATGEYTTGKAELTAEEDGTKIQTTLWWP